MKQDIKLKQWFRVFLRLKPHSVILEFVKCFWKNLFCSPKLHLLDQKYSKISNMEKCSEYCHDQINNLCVVFDPELKFDKQINAVVKSCFSRLRLLLD